MSGLNLFHLGHSSPSNQPHYPSLVSAKGQRVTVIPLRLPRQPGLQQKFMGSFWSTKFTHFPPQPSWTRERVLRDLGPGLSLVIDRCILVRQGCLNHGLCRVLKVLTPTGHGPVMSFFRVRVGTDWSEKQLER